MEQVVIHQNLLKKVDLANLKSNVDKLEIEKLKNVPTNLTNLKRQINQIFDVNKLVPVDLSKLSDAVKMMSLKRMHIMLRYKNTGDKTPDINNLAANASLKAKVNEVKGEIPNTTN